MNLILKRDPVWLGSLPTTPIGTSSLVLVGGDGHQVTVPSALLLAVSPLVRNILTDLIPPAYCPCFLSLPAATGEILQIVMDILARGTVAGDHGDKIKEVRQVFGMLGVEVSLSCCQLESIQVLYGGNEEETGVSLDEENIKREMFVETEEKENTLVGKGLDRDISMENEIKELEIVVKKEDKENTNAEVDKKPKTLISQKSNSNLKNSSKCGLKMHVESTNRKITCHLCPEKFTCASKLFRHIRSVHEQIRIRCNICPKKFTEKSSLVRHIKSVHEQIKFQCNLCSNKYAEKATLVKHIKSTHEQFKFK